MNYADSPFKWDFSCLQKEKLKPNFFYIEKKYSLFCEFRSIFSGLNFYDWWLPFHWWADSYIELVYWILEPSYLLGWIYPLPTRDTGCPKKHGNSVTNLISSLLWISIVTPSFKSHNIIMPVRVYFMKRVKDFRLSPQDEQWIRTSSLCLHTAIFLFY